MARMIIRLFLLRLLLPNLGKYVAEYAANFLQERREARLARREKFATWLSERNENGAERPLECPPCPPCPAKSDTMPAANNANRLWLALSGLLLGSAAGVAGYLFIKDSQA